jgi:hypothetical protein
VTTLVAVLDACVLYPMYLRDTLLRMAEVGLYEARWSQDVLNELRRNLTADALTEEQATRLIGAMQGAFPDAQVSGYEALIPTMRNHEKDRHVVAAAVRTGAEVIVTDNLRDFSSDALEPFGVTAQSSDMFLTRLFGIDPAAAIEVVTRQAASYRMPPRSVEEVLERLAIFAPAFAARVRVMLTAEE